jgi:glycosyltransferase involved in cell wall biosynthesis
MQSLLAAKTRWETNRIVVIPNTADIDQIHPASRENNRLLKKLGLAGKFVVKYAGHMGRTHGLEMLVRGAQLLHDLDPDIHLVFSGSGPKKAWLESIIACRRLNNVTVTPFSPRSEIEDSLNACDIGVISMLPGMAGISVPGRIYDLLAVGKPVIAVTDAHSEIGLLIREEKVGWVVDPEDISGLVLAIQSAKADPVRLVEMGRRSRRVAETKYARCHQVDAYNQLIERMCDL